jgi:PTH2 family peptidyl-tRNA hydrolase
MSLRSFIHRLSAPISSGLRPKEPVKMVCIVNTSLKMGKGKIAAQVGHAAVSATLKAGEKTPELLDAWLSSGQKKVCLKAVDSEHLLELEKAAINQGILSVKIHDAGHTQIPKGSLTVLALGPEIEESVNSLTGELKLL